MTPKIFIEKAIEGGWERIKVTDFTHIATKENGMQAKSLRALVFLDPLAWQSCGFTKKEMVGMIDFLWDGGTIEKYLETL